MNKKAIIVALLASLVVSFFLWNQMQKKQQLNQIQAPVIEQPILKTKVVISKKRIAARTRLEEANLKENFELKEMIASSVPEGAFTSIASLTNRYTSVTVLPNDVMIPERLMNEDLIPNLARAIPNGKRAISIAVSKSSSVGGFIQQGDYVDVIATFRPANGETITKIVLQDIQVLAVGNTYDFEGAVATSSPAIAASKAELITLAMTPDDLEKLMYLDAGTSFRLVLKNPNDKDHVIQTRGATERLVLSDIGHKAAVSPSSQPEVANPVNVAPVNKRLDDGKIEIMFGSSKRREMTRYSGPTGNNGTSYENMSIPTVKNEDNNCCGSDGADEEDLQ